MSSKNPKQRLIDIIENIERIRTYVQGLTYEQFCHNFLVQDAVERCFSRISEAAVKLGNTMDSKYPSIPWVDIRNFGNHIRHAYDHIDTLIIWQSIQEDLEPLKKVCELELTHLQETYG